MHFLIPIQKYIYFTPAWSLIQDVFLIYYRFEAFIGDSKVLVDIDIQPGGVYTLIINGNENYVCIKTIRTFWLVVIVLEGAQTETYSEIINIILTFSICVYIFLLFSW